MMGAQSQGNTKLTNLYLEIISIMSRRYFYKEWTQLIPTLINYLNTSQDMNVYKTVFECIKKICKKYRYMFRSDDLFIEMNYVITNVSQHLLQSLVHCVSLAQQPDSQANLDMIRSLYSVMNSILHIIESIISQEELPDFYEDNCKQIMESCKFILQQDYPKFQQVP